MPGWPASRRPGDHMAARPQYITTIVTQSIRHRCLTCSLLSPPPLEDTFADKYKTYLSYQQTYFTSTNIKWKLLLAVIKNDTVTKLSPGDHKCRVARLGPSDHQYSPHRDTPVPTPVSGRMRDRRSVVFYPVNNHHHTVLCS